MARAKDTRKRDLLKKAITVLFCLVDDSYPLLDPRWQHHELLEGLSDSEVLTLTLLQQLREWRARALSYATPGGSSPTSPPG
jgi:hypothetical protein